MDIELKASGTGATGRKQIGQQEMALTIGEAADGLYWSAMMAGRCIDHGGPHQTRDESCRDMEEGLSAAFGPPVVVTVQP